MASTGLATRLRPQVLRKHVSGRHIELAKRGSGGVFQIKKKCAAFSLSQKIIPKFAEKKLASHNFCTLAGYVI